MGASKLKCWSGRSKDSKSWSVPIEDANLIGSVINLCDRREICTKVEKPVSDEIYLLFWKRKRAKCASAETTGFESKGTSFRVSLLHLRPRCITSFPDFRVSLLSIYLCEYFFLPSSSPFISGGEWRGRKRWSSASQI